MCPDPKQDIVTIVKTMAQVIDAAKRVADELRSEHEQVTQTQTVESSLTESESRRESD